KRNAGLERVWRHEGVPSRATDGEFQAVQGHWGGRRNRGAGDGLYWQCNVQPSGVAQLPLVMAASNQHATGCFAGWSRTQLNGMVSPPSVSLSIDHRPVS